MTSSTPEAPEPGTQVIRALNDTVEIAQPPYKTLLAQLDRELQSTRLPDDADERIARWLYETTAGQPGGRWAGPDTWQFAADEPDPFAGMFTTTTKTARDHYLETARELIDLLTARQSPTVALTNDRDEEETR